MTRPRRNFSFFLIGFLVVTVTVGVFVPLYSAEGIIQVQIPIPGITDACPDDPSKTCVNSLGEYIAGFYRYFAGVIGIFAAVMVMWGGIKWLTASGNQSRITDAKDTIYSALIALLITLGSYAILNTINPALVSLDLPSVNSVSRQELFLGCNNINELDLVASRCNPNNTECCGETMKTTDGRSCTWTICDQKYNVCWTPDETLTVGYSCITAEQLCIQNNHRLSGDDLKEYCLEVDNYIQMAAKKDGSKKFNNAGCSFADGKYNCIYNIIHSSLPDTVITSSGFDKDIGMVDCFTPTAEGVCWELNDGRPEVRACAHEFPYIPVEYCASPGDYPRPVAGAQGACVVKQGTDGSQKDHYECWDINFDNSYLDTNP